MENRYLVETLQCNVSTKHHISFVTNPSDDEIGAQIDGKRNGE